MRRGRRKRLEWGCWHRSLLAIPSPSEGTCCRSRQTGCLYLVCTSAQPTSGRKRRRLRATINEGVEAASSTKRETAWLPPTTSPHYRYRPTAPERLSSLTAQLQQPRRPPSDQSTALSLDQRSPIAPSLSMSSQREVVVLETSMGNVSFELYTAEAPKTCKNFRELARKGYYSGELSTSVQRLLQSGGAAAGAAAES